MRSRSRLAALAVLALVAGCSGKEEVAETPQPVAVAYGLFPDIIDYEPGYPADTCMTKEQVVADQLTKLRTEMMVTGLSCQYRDPALYSRYVGFTVDHQDRIRDAQRTIGDLLSGFKKGRPERLFDTYLTEMANTEARQVNRVSTALYCQARWEQFHAVTAFDEDQLRAYLEQAVEHYRDDYNLCD